VHPAKFNLHSKPAPLPKYVSAIMSKSDAELSQEYYDQSTKRHSSMNISRQTRDQKARRANLPPIPESII